ncbi:hypothetical protein ACXGQW_00935 [Wenyingzhuangia sp. IMCC45533]
MKKILLSIILINTFLGSNAQTVNESTRNITGFNRIQTGNGAWMDIQLLGAGSSFKIRDNTNGQSWLKWTAGVNYTEFLKDIRINANINAVGSRNIYGFNRIQTPEGGWMDIQLAGFGSTFKIHDNTNGGNWVKWTAGSNYTEFLKDVIISSGNLGIGTTDTQGFKLGVNGKIAATEVKVALMSNWSDFVFYDNYILPTLKEVENHIKENGHLKDIPSAKEVEKNGIFLGEMNSKLLQKIEELILYTIQQEKKLKSQDSKIEKLEKKNGQLILLNKKIIELQSRLEKLEFKK